MIFNFDRVIFYIFMNKLFKIIVGPCELDIIFKKFVFVKGFFDWFWDMLNKF